MASQGFDWQSWQAFVQTDLSDIEYHHLSEQLQWFDVLGVRKFKPAAVMVLIEIDTEPQVILTVRSQKLNNHGGQVSFAGGKQDPEDVDEVATALRETEEELGVASAQMTVLGCMPALPTISAYCVHPVIATLPAGVDMNVNADEVDSVFKIPLEEMMRPENYQSFPIERQNKMFDSIKFPHEHHIWGVTAMIMLGLAQAYEKWLQTQNA